MTACQIGSKWLFWFCTVGVIVISQLEPAENKHQSSNVPHLPHQALLLSWWLACQSAILVPSWCSPTMLAFPMIKTLTAGGVKRPWHDDQTFAFENIENWQWWWFGTAKEKLNCQLLTPTVLLCWCANCIRFFFDERSSMCRNEISLWPSHLRTKQSGCSHALTMNTMVLLKCPTCVPWCVCSD